MAARIVHATAEPDLLGSLVVDAEAVAAGVAALRDGSPVLCDVEMVRSGVAAGAALCLLDEVGVAPAGSTRSAAAMARAARRYPNGAVVVVGCAPTALDEVNDRLADGSFRPALVIGVPVGFVGAAAAKERLLEVAPLAGVAAIVLRGERGGAAVGVAAVNALVRLARGAPEPAVAPAPAASGHDVPMAVGLGMLEMAPTMVLIGHGTRSEAGQAELHAFGRAMAEARPDVRVRPGFIEFMRPTLAEALESAAIEASAGTTGQPRVVAAPLVLLGAGHLKDDGPAALARARRGHPDVAFAYGRDLGLHPSVLEVVSDRVREAAGDAVPDAVVLVGRGSSDPDANADLVKAARLLADGRGLSAPAPGPSHDVGPPLAPGRSVLRVPGPARRRRRSRPLPPSRGAAGRRRAVLPFHRAPGGPDRRTGRRLGRRGTEAPRWWSGGIWESTRASSTWRGTATTKPSADRCA